MENHLGAGSPSNTLPWSGNMSNFLEKYEGIVLSGSSLIAANTALNATSIAHVGTSQAGIASGMPPTMMLIEMDSTIPVFANWGDSITYGVGEGVAGSNTYGDAVGSALGNPGYVNRFVGEKLGYNCLNFGRGSDRLAYNATPANIKYRLQLLALANPTHIIQQSKVNDINGGRSLSQIQADMATLWGQLQATVPGAPIFEATCTPCSSSSDTFATAANQTPMAQAATRSSVDAYVRTLRSFRNGTLAFGFIDPNGTLESGYTAGKPWTSTAKWEADGVTANLLTYDGTHPNSYATHLAAITLRNPLA